MKPFKCRYCSYCAAQRKQITVHERVHQKPPAGELAAGAESDLGHDPASTSPFPRAAATNATTRSALPELGDGVAVSGGGGIDVAQPDCKRARTSEPAECGGDVAASTASPPLDGAVPTLPRPVYRSSRVEPVVVPASGGVGGDQLPAGASQRPMTKTVTLLTTLHTCHYCPYASHLKASVLAHERTHTKERRFFCSFTAEGCTYGAARRWQVTIHERTVSQVIFFSASLSGSGLCRQVPPPAD